MKKFLMFALFISVFSLAACTSNKTETKEVPKEESVTTTTAPAPVTTITTTTTTTTDTLVSTTSVTYEIATTSKPITGLANPAATNCIAKGGALKTITRTDGNQYSICYFEDNRQCEEWALFRGDCPWGGRKITGYDNDQQIFCAITGGEVTMNKNTCTFKGKICDLGKYYDGNCND